LTIGRRGPIVAAARKGAVVIESASVMAALEEVRALVKPDGGDFELVALDADAGSLQLRLVLDGASCRECVMERPILEDIATAVVRRSAPGLTRLSIDDPREGDRE
jgi:Fe-S cluster biogenesis protein NfuA